MNEGRVLYGRFITCLALNMLVNFVLLTHVILSSLVVFQELFGVVSNFISRQAFRSRLA